MNPGTNYTRNISAAKSNEYGKVRYTEVVAPVELKEIQILEEIGEGRGEPGFDVLGLSVDMF